MTLVKMRKLTIVIVCDEDMVECVKADLFGWDAGIVSDEEVEVEE